MKTPEPTPTAITDSKSPSAETNYKFSDLIRLSRDQPENFSSLITSIKQGTATYEHEQTNYALDEIPKDIVVKIENLIQLLSYFHLQDWPDPMPYACPLIKSCNSHFYSFEEYQIHNHEISSSNHSTLEHLVLEGFDPLSIVINQLSNMICDFVKPKDTNISFGFYRCYVVGCHSSRGEFHSLIEHFLEKHIGYVELLNQWGFFYGTLTYNLKEYDNPTNIEFTVPQDFGSGDSPAMTE